MKQSNQRISALAAAVLLAVSGSAYAQSTAPAGASSTPGTVQPGQTQTSPGT